MLDKQIYEQAMNGETLLFSQFFPDEESMSFTYDGDTYVIAEQYCCNPNCNCSDLFINMIKVTDDGKTRSPDYTELMTII